MRVITAALVAALALLVPRAGQAQPVSSLPGAGPPTWLIVHLGASIPQHDDLDDVDTGYDLGLRFGGWFSRVVGVEGGVGYLRATGNGAGADRTVWDLPVSANLRVRAPGKTVELSAYGGAALHIASIAGDVPAPGGGTVRQTDEAVAFGFQVGLALDFHLTRTMLVGVDVQRSFVEPEFDGTPVRLDMLRIAVALTHHF